MAARMNKPYLAGTYSSADRAPPYRGGLIVASERESRARISPSPASHTGSESVGMIGRFRSAPVSADVSTA